MTVALEIESVSMIFGGHLVVDDVSISAETGKITGLIGPNGAGKTTLFNVISGLLRPSAGHVRLQGTSLDGLGPHHRAQRGLARTFQRLELFTSLSVRDNVRVAGEIRNIWADDHHDPDVEADRILELVGLRDVAERDVSEVPTGQARVVEVARALMTRPKVLLLDEPASGQDESETAAFGQLLKVLAADGITILVVEHDMSLVMSVCDHLHVLDFGKIIASGDPDDVRRNPAVLDAYLGASDA